MRNIKKRERVNELQGRRSSQRRPESKREKTSTQPREGSPRTMLQNLVRASYR